MPQDVNSRRNFNTLWRRLKSTQIHDPESTIITLKRGNYRVDIRDAFLIGREGGDSRGLDLYYNLLTDPTVFTANERLTTLVYNMERKLKPGDPDDEKSMKCYEWIKEELKKKKAAVRRSIDTQVLAHIMGVTWSEIVWYSENGQISFDIVPADSRRIAFSLVVDEDKRREYYQARIKSDLNLYPGEPVPDRRFIIQTYYTVPIDSPYGLGVGQQLWWLVEFKKAAIELWNQVSDRHAMPLVIGKVPDNTEEILVNNFFDSLEEMAANSTFVIPDDFQIEIQDANTGNADTLITGLIDYCDQKIREVILGESATGASTLKPGLAGAARDARAITLQKAKRITDDVNDTLNNTLIKWLANKNFPGATPPYLVTETTDSEQLSSLASTLLTLTQIGFEADPKWIEEKFGIPAKPKATGLGDQLIEPPPDISGDGLAAQPTAEAEEPPLDSRSITDLNPTEK